MMQLLQQIAENKKSDWVNLTTILILPLFQ